MKRLLFTLTLFLGLSALSLAQDVQVPAYDWAGFERYAADNASRGGHSPLAVIMGDSITDGWLAQDPAFFSDNNIAGRGISGQVTSQMLVRFRRDVLDLHPRCVVIVAGINDIARNQGFISQENMLGNVESMCELAEAHGIVPVLTTLFPADRIPWRPGVENTLEQVHSFNESIRSYARRKGLECIDFEVLMADENGITRSDLCADGIHPNLAGYKVLEEAVLALPALAGARQPRTFTTVREIPITGVKNQYRSGTCWDYATLGFLEAEILRKTGKAVDLCEMFVVNKDYMDCATHYVRMHGYSQISEGGSCDDVLEVIRTHGICPEEAMPAPGSLTGDPYANFKVFFPELERTVSRIVWKDGAPELNRYTTEEQAPLRNKEPMPHWQDSVQAVIDRYVGACPESFVYEGGTYTPRSFAGSLGLNLDDYVSLTSFTHHPFNGWFVIEAPYKWRLKPSYNIPVDELMDLLDGALDKGYTVAWGGDVSGPDFLRKEAVAFLPEGVVPTQELRQERWDRWESTYDHVMLIYGKAVDGDGRPYYLVKNTWGETGPYGGIWYMSRDYIALNTTYIFLNRGALPKRFVRRLSD